MPHMFSYTDAAGVERVLRADTLERARELIRRIELGESSSVAAAEVAAKSAAPYEWPERAAVELVDDACRLTLAGAEHLLAGDEPRRIWYDAPEAWHRCRALVLERGTLYDCQRTSPADQWPAARVVASSITLAGAEAVATTFGLVAEEAGDGR